MSVTGCFALTDEAALKLTLANISFANDDDEEIEEVKQNNIVYYLFAYLDWYDEEGICKEMHKASDILKESEYGLYAIDTDDSSEEIYWGNPSSFGLYSQTVIVTPVKDLDI